MHDGQFVGSVVGHLTADCFARSGSLPLGPDGAWCLTERSDSRFWLTVDLDRIVLELLVVHVGKSLTVLLNKSFLRIDPCLVIVGRVRENRLSQSSKLGY